MPVITTLHTVLSRPSEEQIIIIRELAKASEFLVVMAHHAESLLKDIYGIDGSKITYIPHGIPDLPFSALSEGERAASLRKSLGFKKRDILLTFGLLSPGKGIETMLDAMPEIIREHPEVVYIILGKTHPHLKDSSGDSYRQGLYQQVSRLRIDKHVHFQDQFVSLETLTRYIQSSSIYITPYTGEDQIVSGTLAYAVGMGSITVSTPYWYAREILDDGRGRLVPFGDSGELAATINTLLHDKEGTLHIKDRCYRYGRSMIWPKVGKDYMNLAAKALKRTEERPIPQYAERTVSRIITELPDFNLHHMKVMTDGTGILQHAKYSVPDRRHGYCVDDNARALIVASRHYQLFKGREVIPLIQTYLSFLHFSFNHTGGGKKGKGRFRNFMTYDRRWLEDAGSEDSHGRSLWGLGVAVQCSPNDSIRKMAASLFIKSLPAAEDFESPRAWAFTIVGLHAYMSHYGGDANARRMRTLLSERLLELFRNGSCNGWPWCEDAVTYANGKLSHALILSGQWIPDSEMFEKGIESLRWLLKEQTAPGGHLSIIGNFKWNHREGPSSAFDQQPIEAMSLIEACAEAFRSTGDMEWIDEGWRCLGWFMGRNDLGEKIYDFTTGGCCDGLEATGVNANQGAESTLSWLISLLTMSEMVGEKVLVSK